MKEYLMGLLLEHGDRAFGFTIAYRDAGYTRLFTVARENADFIELIERPQYTAELLPYKLTAKALEYIKSND